MIDRYRGAKAKSSDDPLNIGCRMIDRKEIAGPSPPPPPIFGEWLPYGLKGIPSNDRFEDEARN